MLFQDSDIAHNISNPGIDRKDKIILIQDCIESTLFRVLKTGRVRQTIADEDRILEIVHCL